MKNESSLELCKFTNQSFDQYIFHIFAPTFAISDSPQNSASNLVRCCIKKSHYLELKVCLIKICKIPKGMVQRKSSFLMILKKKIDHAQTFRTHALTIKEHFSLCNLGLETTFSIYIYLISSYRKCCFLNSPCTTLRTVWFTSTLMICMHSNTTHKLIY